MASGSFNQVQAVRLGELAERESSGFSRQADRSDNGSQKNRDLFAAHSIQTPRTDFDFQILSLYLPSAAGFQAKLNSIFSPARSE